MEYAFHFHAIIGTWLPVKVVPLRGTWVPEDMTRMTLGPDLGRTNGKAPWLTFFSLGRHR